MASSASAVKEAVKETVLGSEEPAGPSSQSKARFTRMAVKDETGELYMGPEEFITAVAPDEEDFVSFNFSFVPWLRLLLRQWVACRRAAVQTELARFQKAGEAP